MGAVWWCGSCIRGHANGVAVDGGTHPEPTGRSQPNQAVERTSHTTGFSRMRVAVACGPPLTAGVMPQNELMNEMIWESCYWKDPLLDLMKKLSLGNLEGTWMNQIS